MAVVLFLLVAVIRSVICNTITETSYSSSKQLVCNDNEDCTINCEGADSCKYATVKCPENYDCTLSCTEISACVKIKLQAISVSSLNINCIQPSDSSDYDTTCSYMKINGTGSVYSSLSSANINCISYSSYRSIGTNDPCGYSTFSLINFDSVTLTCSTEYSCQGVNVLTYNNNDININCNDHYSCNFATMIINNSDTININMPSRYSLASATIYIDGVNNKLSGINCHNRDACQYSDFTFKNIYSNDVFMYCFYNHSWSSYDNSCNDMDLYLDASYKFYLSCDGIYGCYDVDINGDCAQTSIYCNDCNENNINIYCDNNNDIFIYPPTMNPTVNPVTPSMKPTVHPTVPPPPTISNPEASSSSSYSFIGFILSLIGLTVTLIIISFCSYNKYKLKSNENDNNNNKEILIPQLISIDDDIEIKEEEEKYDQTTTATIGGNNNKSKQGFEKLGKEGLLNQNQALNEAQNIDINSTTSSTWCQDIMIRRNCYFELIPHLIDHCFAIGVILKFIDINQWNMFIISFLIILFYRIISSIQIFYYTKSIKHTILQLFDLEFYRALLVNYSGDQSDKYEPCSPQKWISLMEATFQTVPMSVFLMTYLISDSYLFSKYVIIVQLALIWSFIVIIIRNMNEDEVCFKNAVTQRLQARLRENGIIKPHELPAKYPWMLILRFLDTFCRISSISLLAARNIYLFIIMIIIEFIILLIYGYNKKTTNTVIYHMFIRCDITKRSLVYERILVNFIMIVIEWVVVGFLLNSNVTSSVWAVYLPYIIVAANIAFGFLYGKIFVPSITWYINKNNEYFGESDIFNQSRSINDLIKRRKWRNILDFIEFGFSINTSVLLINHPKLLENVSEDLEENGAKPFLCYLMSSTQLDPQHYNDMFIGALQAYENKESLNENDYVEPIEFLKQLIGNKSVNINHQTSHNKRTALHILCLKRHQYLLDLMLDDKSFEGFQGRVINPNLFDKNGESALHILCTGNDPNNLQLLILNKLLLSLSNLNINIQSSMNSNETALHYSIKYNNYSLVKTLISNNLIDLSDNIKCKNNENYLHYAASHNEQNENIALMILNNNKYKYNVNSVEINGNTVLHLSYEKPNFVKKLLQCKEIDINIGNNSGIVPIVPAIQYSANNHSLKILIKHQSLNINSIDNNGNSILHFCIKTIKHNTEHIQLILNHVAINVNILNNFGDSCLHECYSKNLPISHIKLLLNHPLIDVNIQSSVSGNTSLHIAIRLDLWNNSRMSKLNLLLSHKNIMKSKRIQNKSGKTPINCANQQYNDAQQRLQRARIQLMERKRELTNAQNKYQQKANVYQQKLIKYEMKKQQYDMKYSLYQTALNNYNSLPPEIKNRSRRPSSPSTSIYSSEESAMRSAKNDMDSAERHVEHCVQRVNDATNLVSHCELEVDVCQSIINTITR